MRLQKIQECLKEKGWSFQYTEEDGLGSVDFEYRGIGYHVWEFEEDGFGAESNVRDGGRQVEYRGDYEEESLGVMENWK